MKRSPAASKATPLGEEKLCGGGGRSVSRVPRYRGNARDGGNDPADRIDAADDCIAAVGEVDVARTVDCEPAGLADRSLRGKPPIPRVAGPAIPGDRRNQARSARRPAAPGCCWYRRGRCFPRDRQRRHTEERWVPGWRQHRQSDSSVRPSPATVSMRPGLRTGSDPVAMPAISALPSRLPSAAFNKTAPLRKPGNAGAKITLMVHCCPAMYAVFALQVPAAGDRESPCRRCPGIRPAELLQCRLQK